MLNLPPDFCNLTDELSNFDDDDELFELFISIDLVDLTDVLSSTLNFEEVFELVFTELCCTVVLLADDDLVNLDSPNVEARSFLRSCKLLMSSSEPISEALSPASDPDRAVKYSSSAGLLLLVSLLL